MEKSKQTQDYEEIRRWAEARGGKPAFVKGTEILRFSFDDKRNENLEPIEWEKFFEVFDKAKLSFLFQEKTDTGEQSRFNKFVTKR